MKLGVDFFSLRFNDWDAFQLLDYCRQLGVDLVHFSELIAFKTLDKGYLNEVKQHADHLNLSVEVGMRSICPTSTSFVAERGSASDQLSEMLHIAALFGSPAVRCFLGSNADRRTPTPLQGHIDATVATCKSVRSLAVELGI